MYKIFCSEDGFKLYEVSDVVIDNCGEIGDASTPVKGTDKIIFPTSSIANAFICQSINGEVSACLRDMGCITSHGKHGNKFHVNSEFKTSHVIARLHKRAAI